MGSLEITDGPEIAGPIFIRETGGGQGKTAFYFPGGSAWISDKPSVGWPPTRRHPGPGAKIIPLIRRVRRPPAALKLEILSAWRFHGVESCHQQ